MTSDFSGFAARFREFQAVCGVQPSGCSAPVHAEAWTPNWTANAHFNALALELFRLQFAHNPPYRQFCESRRATPESVEHWTQIPAVPTSAFKELDLSCLPPDERLIVFHSSGTTEHRPSRHFHSEQSLAIYEASLWPWFQKNVLGVSGVSYQVPGARCQVSSEGIRSAEFRFGAKEAADTHAPNQSSALQTAATPHLTLGTPHRTPDTWHLTLLTPRPSQAPHSSLVHMLEIVRSKLGAPDSSFVGKVATHMTWTLDFGVAVAALRKATAGECPTVLLGTAFSFVHLLDYLAAQKVRLVLPPGSRVMETGGYKGRSRSLAKTELHSLLTHHLGIPQENIVCEYGMSELCSQAYDRVAGIGRTPRPSALGARLFCFPPWTRVQVISPETGREVRDSETGLIRVCDLANVFSVMAIQTEDLGVRCGEGFELIGRATAVEPRGCSLMTI